MEATVKYSPFPSPVDILNRAEYLVPEVDGEPIKKASALLADWTKAKARHRECLIRAALLRFLTPFEIDLTAKTRSKALLDYYSLQIEHINGPGVLRNGPNTFLPETLRIIQHGKLVLSVNLEMGERGAA